MNVISISNGQPTVKSVVSMLPGNISSLRHFNVNKSNELVHGVGTRNIKVDGRRKSAIDLSSFLSPNMYEKIRDHNLFGIDVNSSFYRYKHVKPKDLRGQAETGYSFVSYVDEHHQHTIGQLLELFSNSDGGPTYAVVSVLLSTNTFDCFDCPIYRLTDNEVVIPAEDILSVQSMNHNCTDDCKFLFVNERRPDSLSVKGDLPLLNLQHDTNLREFVLNVYRW
jgi:hypothetical protein